MRKREGKRGKEKERYPVEKELCRGLAYVGTH